VHAVDEPDRSEVVETNIIMLEIGHTGVRRQDLDRGADKHAEGRCWSAIAAGWSRIANRRCGGEKVPGIIARWGMRRDVKVA